MPHSKKHTHTYRIWILIALIGIILPGVFFMIMYQNRPQKAAQPLVQKPFNGDALLDAVNVKRKAYGYEPLKKNSWVCSVAQIRLQDDLKVGNGRYDNQKGYKAAIQEVTNEYNQVRTSNKVDPLPKFRYQYTFYAPTIDEGMKYFLQNTIYITLFTKKELQFGCGAAKNKYGLIVTAE